jgi:hypothetical protein
MMFGTQNSGAIEVNYIQNEEAYGHHVDVILTKSKRAGMRGI